jgi:hypothetical protein
MFETINGLETAATIFLILVVIAIMIAANFVIKVYKAWKDE